MKKILQTILTIALIAIALTVGYHRLIAPLFKDGGDRNQQNNGGGAAQTQGGHSHSGGGWASFFTFFHYESHPAPAPVKLGPQTKKHPLQKGEWSSEFENYPGRSIEEYNWDTTVDPTEIELIRSGSRAVIRRKEHNGDYFLVSKNGVEEKEPRNLGKSYYNAAVAANNGCLTFKIRFTEGPGTVVMTTPR